MEDSAFLDNYEKTLQLGLSRICSGAGLMGEDLLSSEDIDAKWEEFIKDYVADAVENFNDYPEAALAWAATWAFWPRASAAFPPPTATLSAAWGTLPLNFIWHAPPPPPPAH